LLIIGTWARIIFSKRIW